MMTNDSQLCPKCHTLINSSMRFCGACGAKLPGSDSITAIAEPTSAAHVVPAPPSSPAPSEPPSWLVIGSTITVFILLAGSIGGYLLVDHFRQPGALDEETLAVPRMATPDEDPYLLNLEDMPDLEDPKDELLNVAGMGEHPDYLTPDEPITYDDGSTDTYEDNDANGEALDPVLRLEFDNVLATYEQLVDERSTPASQSMSPGIGMNIEVKEPDIAIERERTKTNDFQKASSKNLKDYIDTGNEYYREQNYAMAVTEIEQAANMGHSDSQRFMGMMYENGTGVRQDYEKARQWYAMSAKNNNPSGLYNLALLYSQGLGMNKDMQKAHSLFLEAANLGYSKAQYNLGIIYKMGLGVEKDHYQSFHWVAMAARQNLAEALYVVGYDYEYGEGVEKDENKALEYYGKAAELGEERAIKRTKQH